MFTKFRWKMPFSQMWKQLSQFPKVGMKFNTGSKSPQLVDKEEKYPLPKSKKRIGLYLARWLGWACIVAPSTAVSGICNVLITTPPACICSASVVVSRTTTDGSSPVVMDSLQCDNAQSSATCNAPTTDNTTGTHYYQNTTELSSYYKCDWVAGVGYTTGTASTYTPTSPAPLPPITNSTIYRVPFAPPYLLLLSLLGVGLTFVWRNKNKSD